MQVKQPLWQTFLLYPKSTIICPRSSFWLQEEPQKVKQAFLVHLLSVCIFPSEPENDNFWLLLRECSDWGGGGGLQSLPSPGFTNGCHSLVLTLHKLLTRMALIFHQDKWKQGHTQVLGLPFSASKDAEAFHLGWQGRTIGIYAVVAW